MRGWPRRRWAVAALAVVGTVLVVGIPTVLVPTPVFGREIAVTWWAWPALLVTAVLAGLVSATYVRAAPLPAGDDVSRAGVVGGFLTYLAVGCPVCNKVALLALGYTGALQWFAPVQPVLAVAGIAVLAYALHRRLLGEIACPAPQAVR
ncbi:MAG: hypothetical protein LCI03_05215 [Actinobacteria bacterium]|jgi:hypothetical protein|nr:hypothetical protein [Actinomycetota bacterium]